MDSSFLQPGCPNECSAFSREKTMELESVAPGHPILSSTFSREETLEWVAPLCSWSSYPFLEFGWIQGFYGRQRGWSTCQLVHEWSQKKHRKFPFQSTGLAAWPPGFKHSLVWRWGFQGPAPFCPEAYLPPTTLRGAQAVPALEHLQTSIEPLLSLPPVLVSTHPAGLQQCLALASTLRLKQVLGAGRGQAVGVSTSEPARAWGAFLGPQECREVWVHSGGWAVAAAPRRAGLLPAPSPCRPSGAHSPSYTYPTAAALDGPLLPSVRLPQLPEMDYLLEGVSVIEQFLLKKNYLKSSSRWKRGYFDDKFWNVPGNE